MVQNGVELPPQPISMRTRSMVARGEQHGYSGDEEMARRSDTPSTEEIHSTSSDERRRRWGILRQRDSPSTESPTDMPPIPSLGRHQRHLVRSNSPIPSTSAGFSGLNITMLQTPRTNSDSSE